MSSKVKNHLFGPISNAILMQVFTAMTRACCVCDKEGRFMVARTSCHPGPNRVSQSLKERQVEFFKLCSMLLTWICLMLFLRKTVN